METAPRSSPSSTRWLNRTVLGIGLASLFSDWSHEMATTVMPAFLATMGVAAFWVGLIEGVSDGLSSFAKMASGYYTDKLRRRKPVAVIGYVVTALGTASFGLAMAAWHVLMARAFPSSQAADSLAIVLAFSILAWRTRWRWEILATGILYVLAVGLFRVHLGLHYPSDIVAGWALALAWVTAVSLVRLIPNGKSTKPVADR